MQDYLGGLNFNVRYENFKPLITATDSLTGKDYRPTNPESSESAQKADVVEQAILDREEIEKQRNLK